MLLSFDMHDSPLLMIALRDAAKKFERSSLPHYVQRINHMADIVTAEINTELKKPK